MDTTPSHVDPRLDALREQLHSERCAFVEAVALVPRNRRQTRPAPDRWSVAEVIAHVALVETRIAGLLVPLASTAPSVSDRERDAAVGTAGGTAVDMAVLLDRTRRFPAPAAPHPTAGCDADVAMEALVVARATMLDAMRAIDGRALEAVQRAHPALGVLDGYQWIASVAGHEARHAAQIREIGAALAATDAENAESGNDGYG